MLHDFSVWTPAWPRSHVLVLRFFQGKSCPVGRVKTCSFPYIPPEINDTGPINVHENLGSWPLHPIRMAAARQTLFIGKRKLHTKRETYENESAARQEKPLRENLVLPESRSRLYYNLEGVRLLTTRQHKIVNERPTTTEVTKTVR